MPRMTRAARRAQQVEEGTELQHDNPTSENELENSLSKKQTRSTAQIYEDLPETEAAEEPETTLSNTSTSHIPPVRLALRDITDENYPLADVVQFDEKLASQIQTHPSQETQPELQTEVVEPPKSTKRGRRKAKSRTKKKVDTATAVVVEPEVEELEEQIPVEDIELNLEPRKFIEEPTIQVASSSKEPQLQSIPHHSLYLENPLVTPVDDDGGPGPAIEEIEDYTISQSLTSKTPKFDPSVHLSDHEAGTVEDSFLHSITSRSPSKLSQSDTDYIQPSQSFNNSLQAFTPLRRTSSRQFEESFEAMDSLEDSIEQLTAGLPVLAADDIDSPESPLKLGRRSLVVDNRSTTLNMPATRTPKSSTKLQFLLAKEEKENTPLKVRTPLIKETPSLKHKTPLVKEKSPTKPQTPAASALSPSKSIRGSIRKSVVKPTANDGSTTPRTAPREQVVVAHQTSASFSNSPLKEQPNIHKKRSTSSVLSTAKPGFIPAKSSKPPTTSNFALPGEAVAERLRAQREAREEKMKEPKMSLAEQKAAKLKADREAREERVRQNQEKQREVSNTEKPKPVLKHTRPLSVHVQPSISPRENKASQARMSRIFSGSDKENVAPQTATAAAPSSSRTTLAVSKTRTDTSTTSLKPNTAANRRSVVVQSPRKDLSTVTVKPRPSSANITAAQHARIMFISNGQRSNITKEDVAQQKVRGKEVFRRAQQTLQQEQKEKREKEEAARKARADAAAAGRMASREWAEKMMKKKQSQQEAKNESGVTIAVSEVAVESA